MQREGPRQGRIVWHMYVRVLVDILRMVMATSEARDKTDTYRIQMQMPAYLHICRCRASALFADEGLGERCAEILPVNPNTHTILVFSVFLLHQSSCYDVQMFPVSVLLTASSSSAVMCGTLVVSQIWSCWEIAVHGVGQWEPLNSAHMDG